MKANEFQVRGVDDARLAVHATGSLPAWLWSTDGTRILWANPVGASLFDARNATVLAARTFGPADPHRRQITQLASRLRVDGGIRLERLRGFGATFGRLATCACTRLNFGEGDEAILIVAAEPLGRAMPLVERLQRLVEGVETPVAAFGRDGLFVGASDAARALLGFRNLSEAGLNAARDGALKDGRVETSIGVGSIVLQRVGNGADVALVALLAPGTVLRAAQPETPAVDTPVLQSDAPVAHITTPDNVVPAPAVTAPPVDSMTPSKAADETGALLIEPLREQPAEVMHADPHLTQAVLPVEFVDHLAQDSTNDETITDAVGLENTEVAETPAALEPPHEPRPQAAPVHDLEPPSPRLNPLRFVWQMHGDGRFELRSEDFLNLIGPHTAAAFAQPWRAVVSHLPIDPEGRVAAAVATRTTWSGIALDWPVDPPGQPLPVELSGLPVFDAASAFAGYRGFGICRDLAAMTQLDALRQYDDGHQHAPGAVPRALSAQSSPRDHDVLQDQVHLPPTEDAVVAAPDMPASQFAHHDSVVQDVTSDDFVSHEVALQDTTAQQFSFPEAVASESSVSEPPSPESEHPVDTPLNVVSLRPSLDPKSLALTPVENNAFNELARQLSARLENENLVTSEPPSETPAADTDDRATPDWLGHPPTPAVGAALRDRVLMDLLPVGVLIYRLDRLLYANPTFLAGIRRRSLRDLEDAGGLDSLYIEAGVSSASSTSDTGTPVTIAAAGDPAATPTAARLFTITWDGEAALALIGATGVSPVAAMHVVVAAPAVAAPPAPAIPVPGQPDAEELGAILDTAAEGIVMFDGAGRIHACNRSAEALFGYDGAQLTQRPLADLFAPESRNAVASYLDRIKSASASGLHDHGREVLGSVRSGGLMPLALTMGRTRADGLNFFAVFRDLTQLKKSEAELAAARRQSERSANAKAETLSRISHEVRTPLNAIIGFADVMIEERFGPLGNERYVEYMKDVRASGERVIAIIDDLSDLARIETGNIDLAFANQDLNVLVEQCVAVLQPQANRERIIIRSSLAHDLPPVVADGRALRQIMLNLIGNSIHLARAGGQVIVSTALSDLGEVVLRVRDTGHGLNDNELAAVLQPFRAANDEPAGVNLSLTRALVEANRAQFNIKTAPHGTLIEVVFSHAPVGA